MLKYIILTPRTMKLPDGVIWKMLDISMSFSRNMKLNFRRRRMLARLFLFIGEYKVAMIVCISKERERKK